MSRTPRLLLLVLLPWTTAAGVAATPDAALEVTTAVTLDREGAGRVTIAIETDLKRRDTLVASLRAVGEDAPLMPMLLGDTLTLKTLLEKHDFSNVRIRQELRPEVQRTTVSARIDGVRSLGLFGGELTFTEGAGSTLVLRGTLGHERAGAEGRLAPLRDVRVTFNLEFPGTVTEHDASARPSHAGNAVIYTATADRLLASAIDVDVRIIPDVEGQPWYWLTLIAVVTGLVVLGAVIVLQKGKNALGTADRGLKAEGAVDLSVKGGGTGAPPPR